MKRAAAIILSLMFVWLQAVATQTPFGAVANVCDCCACKEAGCCVSKTTPDTQPPLAPPVQAGHASDFSLFAPVLVTWTLPVTTSSQTASFDSASSFASAVPLFTRHCALLI